VWLFYFTSVSMTDEEREEERGDEEREEKKMYKIKLFF
jgi:hypothetical protein